MTPPPQSASVAPAPPAGASSPGPATPTPAGQPPRTRPAVLLHLVWDGRDLLCWGERALSDPFRLLRTGADGIPPHPHALDAAALTTALRLGSRGAPQRTGVRLVLRFPARPAGWRSPDPARLLPVPSPELGGPVEGEYPLAPFAVTAWPVEAEAVAAVLFGRVPAEEVERRAEAQLRDGGPQPFGTLPGDVGLAGDARFWRQVARFALGLCARGHVRPGLGRTPRGQTAAMWVPAPDAAEREAMQRLAAALPPACQEAAQGQSPTELVQSLLALAVDAAARTLLAPQRARWTRECTGTEAPARWLLGLVHPVPLPLAAPSAWVAEVARWSGSRPEPAPGLGGVRLVLRLDEPVPDEETVGAQAGPASGEVAAPAADAQEEGEGEEADSAEGGGSAGLPTASTLPLRLLVQTVDVTGAPGDLVPLGAATEGLLGEWREGPPLGPAATDLRRRVLDALTTAARIFPPLYRALRDPRLDEIPLTPEEAAELLGPTGRRLAAEGVDVVVPAWWARAPASATARLRMEDAGAGSAEDWIGFRWEVALGGETLAPEAFEALVRSRRPLVRLRSGWVRVGPETWRLPRLWHETGGAGRLPVLGAVRLALAAGAEAGGAGAGSAAAPTAGIRVELSRQVSSWLERLQRVSEVAPLPEPPGFRGTLRPYQRLGLGWLDRLAELGLGGCLADDMGLGKTVQVLALLLHRKARGQASGPTLLVCPTSVLGNWQAEASRFAPELRVLVWYGSARPRGEALAALARSADMVLTTYGLLARDGEALAALPWDGVILDEAQNIKNPAVQQARVARGLRARYRFALTGTPVENGLGDLWSIFAFALPGYLGSERSFRRHYARPVAHGDGAALARLRRVIAPFVLRRSKRDPGVADELPPKIEVRHDCPLTREQAALYEAVVRQSLEEIARAQGLRRRATILATLLRLKQICDHPALFTGDPGPLEGRSGKLRRLEELLADVLAEGDRALVFTQFATWARRLQAYLAARCPCPVWCLDGSVPGAQRTELVRRFQEGEGPAVFVLSLKAGGAGLNLTAAQHVFHYDRWWNPAVEEQATDRTYRIGQVRSVQVHKFLVPGTLEERIDALLAGKAAVARELLARDGGVEAWLAELDVDRLREVLALGPGWGEE